MDSSPAPVVAAARTRHDGAFATASRRHATAATRERPRSLPSAPFHAAAPLSLTRPDHERVLGRPLPFRLATCDRATFGAGRRRRDLRERSTMRTSAQSRAEIEPLRACVPYIAGREFSAATVMSVPALMLKRRRFLGAYGPILREPKHRAVPRSQSPRHHPQNGATTPNCRTPLRALQTRPGRLVP